MKKAIIILTYALIITTMLSCERKDGDKKTAFTLSGYITSQNKPIENVTLTIDDKYNLKSTSNSEGYFTITGLASGDHELHMKKMLSTQSKSADQDTSIFVEKTIALSINQDTELDDLKLPKAVTIYDPKNVTQSTAGIAWSATDDSEFREYKLYRHNSSGLDETTGTLVHVSTSLNDTIFTDTKLNPFENYYYRIYVMDDFGRIGGSNIINIKTKNIELIINGGFEAVSSDKPDYWSIVANDIVYTKNAKGNANNFIKVDPNNSFEGKNSLQFHHAEVTGCWEMWITQKVDKTFLVEGGTYKFSLNYKSNFTRNETLTLGLRNSVVEKSIYIPIEFKDNGAWQELTYQFGMPENIGKENVDFSVVFCIQGINSWWLDNIKLEKVE